AGEESAQADLRDRLDLFHEEGGIGQRPPARQIAGIGTADAAIKAAEETVEKIRFVGATVTRYLTGIALGAAAPLCAGDAGTQAHGRGRVAEQTAAAGAATRLNDVAARRYLPAGRGGEVGRRHHSAGRGGGGSGRSGSIALRLARKGGRRQDATGQEREP